MPDASETDVKIKVLAKKMEKIMQKNEQEPVTMGVQPGPKARRLVWIKVSYEFLATVLGLKFMRAVITDGSYLVSNAPGDLEIHDMVPIARGLYEEGVELLCSSEEFDEVPDGEELPIITFAYKCVTISNRVPGKDIDIGDYLNYIAAPRG